MGRLHNKFLVLTLIIAFAGFLRLYQLTEYPVSLSHDEVAIGYNAYSLLKTGNDEYGIRHPLLFKSFDDYKLPGMVYLTSLTVALAGLNELGVRLPSALLGTLSVLVLYGIMDEFLRYSILGKQKIFGILYPVWGTLSFAGSVWHINFSRQSFESNGAVFFLLLGTYLLLLSVRKPRAMLGSAVSFAGALYFYYSVRLIIPPILLAYAVVYRHHIARNVKIAIMAILTGFICILPLLPQIFSAGGFARISMVSVVNDKNYISRLESNTRIIYRNPTLMNKLIYNRRLALAQTVAENYLKNISPSHILASGTGSMGLIHIYEFPFLLVGLFQLAFLPTPHKWIIIIWLVSGFLPGAFSVDQPNPLRTLPNAPVLSLLIALGLGTVIVRLKKQSYRSITVIIFVCTTLWGAVYFFSVYRAYQVRNAVHFADGNKQMVKFISGVSKNYEAVLVSGNYWRPYIFTLFWSDYPPRTYQQTGSPQKFGKFIFGSANWDKSGVNFGDESLQLRTLSPTGRTLVILTPDEYVRHVGELKFISTINGAHASAVFVAAGLR